MKHPGNITALAALNPDYMGFIFYKKSPRYISEPAAEILSLPKDIKKTGVFVNESVENILPIAADFRLDVIQLHGKESVEDCLALKEKGFEVLKVISVAEKSDLDRTSIYENCCDYFLFDTKTPEHGGSGKKFNWEVLNVYQGNTPFFLSGGIGLEDVTEVLSFSHPGLYGLDINSCFEIEAALKDISKVEDFIKQIRTHISAK
ncbi:MAG: phosphoribosylanthranilate isomerase [Candidatus Azobacteroides sp.]|nr:phosphoribosylanthranilate isomerase [Candidatus Azobacteroides sp.]